MEEAHDTGGVMEGHVVIQRRVDGTRPQSQRDGAQAHHQQVPREGEPQQSGGGHSGADSGGPVGSQQADDLGAQHAGYDRPAADGHADEAGEGDGQMKSCVNRRPGGAEQGVRNAQADEGDIDDDK